ncbi:MAG TPA: Na/Pi cotransporter family protein [Firmicutes bacterium]|jgi:phosphate:Na+ symporter|nr:Na/Pi cotransporter family protein [Bacillota bacterium]
MSFALAAGIVGGLGLFLFGIQMMASGMQKVAGDNLRRVLGVLTGKPFMGVLTGAAVTVVIQSSSTTTAMLVGFVNAGLMTLPQAFSAIMGSNIGTTITAQMISFKLDFLALPAVGIGGLLNYFSKRKLHRYLGQVILGFGLLFTGIITMSNTVHVLRDNPLFLDMLVRFGQQPILGVLIAALFTAVIQSSSATTGIIIALSLQETITIATAIPLILGTNIGTCITAIIAGFGTSLSARRTALSHVIFNVFGVLIFLIFLKPFTAFILGTGGTIARQAANAHTLFNVFTTVLIFPFFKYFVQLVTFIYPGESVVVEFGSKYLDKRMLMTPAVAIQGARQELVRMANVARDSVREAVSMFDKGNLKSLSHILQLEELIDGLEKEITHYLQSLSQHSLTYRQTIVVSGIINAANDMERIGDHAVNIAFLSEAVIEDKLVITPVAKEEILTMFNKVDEITARAIDSFSREDRYLARDVVRQDDIVDNLEKSLRKSHIGRINRNECIPESGVIYLDILSNLERIADHATNLAEVVTGEFA